jgi:hypothetical protein
VHAVLTRHGMHRLAWLDRPTGELIRRYERARPGELVHVDVKKLGSIRDGGGWRVHGRGSAQGNRSRDEQLAGRRMAMTSCAARSMTTPGWPTPTSTLTKPPRHAPGSRAAAAFFATVGIDGIERVMTDNAMPTERATPGAKP